MFMSPLEALQRRRKLPLIRGIVVLALEQEYVVVRLIFRQFVHLVLQRFAKSRQEGRLRVTSEGDRPRMAGKVRLVCGDCPLSTAENWHVPRLTHRQIARGSSEPLFHFRRKPPSFPSGQASHQVDAYVDYQLVSGESEGGILKGVRDGPEVCIVPGCVFERLDACVLDG